MGILYQFTRSAGNRQAAGANLAQTTRIYVTNSGTLELGYTLTSFDLDHNAAFELTVTDNASGDVVYHSDTADSAGGGRFSLDLSKAEIPDGFRTIYDVSVKAKNTSEPDWSRDSFTLYIYDRDALQIQVQEVVRDGQATVTFDGNTVHMSNEDWIASLNQDQILALNRDIDLQAELGINYDDHPWGEASDRVEWSSQDSSTAAVNYPQGAYYEDIEDLPYTSFAPATEFLLSSKNDGTTVVEAIHALAGDALSDQVTVQVETLKDKLYLFQFYPAAAGTEFSYINGDGVEKHCKTDDQGRGAVYEASGIASNVYVEAMVGGEKYMGTVYHEDLVSQEKDAVSLELYPLNSITMRKAGSLPIYLKNPDGTDYNGTVQVRVGVYRNGEWCEEAYADSEENPAEDGKTTDYEVQFVNGQHTFEFALDQFSTASQPNADTENPVTAADDIQFVLELRANGYYPVLFTAYGSLNEADAVRLAQRVVNLERVPSGQANKPFVAQQALYYTGQESGIAVDVRNKSGKVGPSKA